MQYMGLNEIREAYLSFFESKGHLRLKSFSLIPRNDRSILLINAGMTPLKPYFTGQEQPPCKRITTCQKCIRTPDIERVGKTSRHGTFFEMLGNFSFGDYFKREACAWAWEFVTQTLKMPADRLYVTVYTDDDEAYDIWTKEIGVDPSHVSRLGRDDNFWDHGSGPCGPCSEIYYDRGEEYGCGKPDCRVGCDCDRYVEFWNIVFSQFNNDGHGNYTPLEHKNIDTGMGLERLACIMQGVDSLFDVDTIKNITLRLSQMTNIKYGQNHDTDVSLRVVTDHIRSTTFMVCDGVLPSNEGRGYVLRRLLRRAARHGRLLGIKDEHFLSHLADTVIHESGSAYPELREKADYIKKVIEQEEDRFNQTVDQGLVILGQLIRAAKAEDKSVLDGADTFKLYDTFGFPADLTREIAAEDGLGVDEEGFELLMQEQKNKARAAAKGFAASAWKSNDITASAPATEFTGYSALAQSGAKILAVLRDGAETDVINQGEQAALILDKTPFYAESGGQVADRGVIRGEGSVFEVTDCQKANGVYIHTGAVTQGSFCAGDSVEANVDEKFRRAVMLNHSAAHLLQAALKKVLGPHVAQAGSYVDDRRVRFDFTHFEALSAEQTAQAEQLVNEYIASMTDVQTSQMSLQEARESGATALFGEKYGQIVRVVKMGDISSELCGGTHVSNTAQIGLFKIISESGVAAGVRRIEAVTGGNILALLRDREAVIASVSGIMKTNEKDLAAKAEAMLADNKALQRRVSELNGRLAAAELENIVKNAAVINGKTVVTAQVDAPADELRAMCDILRDKYPDIVALLASVNDGKVAFAAACGKNAVAAGAHAGKLVKTAAAICGGGGGGRPDSATAGGRDASALDKAFEAVRSEL